jgi:hypothetical protein
LFEKGQDFLHRNPTVRRAHLGESDRLTPPVNSKDFLNARDHEENIRSLSQSLPLSAAEASAASMLLNLTPSCSPKRSSSHSDDSGIHPQTRETESEDLPQVFGGAALFDFVEQGFNSSDSLRRLAPRPEITKPPKPAPETRFSHIICKATQPSMDPASLYSVKQNPSQPVPYSLQSSCILKRKVPTDNQSDPLQMQKQPKTDIRVSSFSSSLPLSIDPIKPSPSFYEPIRKVIHKGPIIPANVRICVFDNWNFITFVSHERSLRQLCLVL